MCVVDIWATIVAMVDPWGGDTSASPIHRRRGSDRRCLSVCVSCLRRPLGFSAWVEGLWRAVGAGILNAVATDAPRVGESAVSARIGPKRRRRRGGVPDTCEIASVPIRRTEPEIAPERRKPPAGAGAAGFVNIALM